MGYESRNMLRVGPVAIEAPLSLACPLAKLLPGESANIVEREYSRPLQSAACTVAFQMAILRT